MIPKYIGNQSSKEVLDKQKSIVAFHATYRIAVIFANM